MIHVCYALHDKNGKYSRLTRTSICSLFANTKAWVTIHLLHDKTLTGENRQRFIELSRQYVNHIVFYNMDELFDIDAIVQKYVGTARKKGLSLQYSLASLYRLLLMHVLPKDIHRLIYLDSDIVVNCDIQNLWNEEVGENGLAAVPEMKIFHWEKANETKAVCNDGFVKFERYFNSGVLLLDLDVYRQYPTLLKDGLSFLVEHPTYSCFDQDILNYVFSEHCRLLDVRYNTFVETERRRGGGEQFLLFIITQRITTACGGAQMPLHSFSATTISSHHGTMTHSLPSLVRTTCALASGFARIWFVAYRGAALFFVGTRIFCPSCNGI